MDPIVTSSLIGAASGFLANKMQSQPKVDYTHLKKGIQWRVDDAKAAGVHPLFALGANVSSPTVTTGGNASNASAALAGGLKGYSTHKLNAANLAESQARARLTNKQADLVDLQLVDSRNKINGQNANSNQDPQAIELTGPYGGKFKTSQSSQAEIVEQEYGGLSGELYGLYRATQDGGKNLGPKVYKILHKHKAKIEKNLRDRHANKVNSDPNRGWINRR